MLRLQIHNDGKEKYQSFDARLDDRDRTIYLEGYGENKDEESLPKEENTPCAFFDKKQGIVFGTFKKDNIDGILENVTHYRQGSANGASAMITTVQLIADPNKPKDQNLEELRTKYGV